VALVVTSEEKSEVFGREQACQIIITQISRGASQQLQEDVSARQDAEVEAGEAEEPACGISERLIQSCSSSSC